MAQTISTDRVRVPDAGMASVTDRAYWISLARAHHVLGNVRGRSWALANARRAPVRPSLMAARLAHTEKGSVVL